MTAEIKAVARQHLETDGASLSLRAVARDMGMAAVADMGAGAAAGGR